MPLLPLSPDSMAAPASASDALDRSPQPAGILRRLAAFGYDSLLLAGVLSLYTGTVLALRGGRAIEPNTAWYSLSLPIVVFCFFGWFWTHGGQTLGMAAWRIRLATVDGSRLRWRHAIVRYLAAWLSFLPAGLGFWWSCVDRERRAWHDIVSGTVLLYETTPRPE